ncbi:MULTISPECIES: SIS domain-containing protein [unclassified Mesorhizobium]|uniref:SIS domain-containing protein n=1 Tax=unclassified Mesorhizobium TaxID=325217 RepID=UPI00112A202F|nr:MULTISPECIES: SIS domain-containing protein [unclassified Mesorhizobium]MBZ9811295.1 SIS domain-containing protein [Mesorhizobium sp. ESP-6-2]TPM25868.1 SIS domain-containing protein [Mesorhizobium sp. B2-2-2]
MSQTEKVIFQQFPYWLPVLSSVGGERLQPRHTVILGCGTSYNLSLSLAAAYNAAGHSAQAVPANEWLRRRHDYAVGDGFQVVVLSRSGETTEAILAARSARAAGDFVMAITCSKDSEIVSSSERAIVAETHPEEGIVMSVSASLMLIAGLKLAGISIDARIEQVGESLLRQMDAESKRVVKRSHFVFLGAGALYGIAAEGGLKLQEMSQVISQTYHPLEYRHGPVSLIGDKSAVVLLYSEGTREEESMLAAELSAKGALVVGLGGPGDISLPVAVTGASRAIAVLPALQILGERVAQARGLDTVSPRFLTKVVNLG